MALDETATALDAALRTPLFFFGFAGIALWEAFAPQRLTVRATIAARWRVNIALLAINVALLNLLLPGLVVAAAAAAVAHGIGLFTWLDTPGWLAFATTFVVLDFGRYLSHWLLHRIPLLWRLHRSHHSDPEYDLTTGFRFHPIEAVIQAAFGIALAAALGGPILAVFLSEVWSTVTAMFTHANVRMPLAVDAFLRRFIVTPDLHRIHHSVRAEEATSNLGNTFVLWDRLFGTYRDQPVGGHQGMTIGHPAYRSAERLTLRSLLVDPFALSRPPGKRSAPL